MADFEVLKKVLLQQGEPDRVPFYEIFADPEIMEAVTGEPLTKLDRRNKDEKERYLRGVIKFYHDLGYDYVTGRAGRSREVFSYPNLKADDTAGLQREQREWQDEHHGVISDANNIQEYPWPAVQLMSWYELEFLNKNLPDGMKIVFLGPGGIYENTVRLIGFETMCYKVFEDPGFVEEIVKRVTTCLSDIFARALQFENVGAVALGDDMGYKTGTMMSPDVMKKFVLPFQKRLADIAHARGVPFILHSCGNLKEIMDNLIDTVRIDAKHSYEDVILPVTEAKKIYGKRIAILGGIDMDFLCRHTEDEVRTYTRSVLEQCAPGGGYALGTGNSVANYVPVRNYLAMLDEGRKFG